MESSKCNAKAFDYRHYENKLTKKSSYKPSGKSITVITPTGDRFEAFRKCLLWVLTQTVKPDQWIIVDDGVEPLSERLILPEWASYVRREPNIHDPKHTLTANLKEAIPLVEHENVFIMEDDDWYSKKYIEFMYEALNNSDHEMVGLNVIRYYHVRALQSKSGQPKYHTALAQTACKKVALLKLLELCDSSNEEIRNNGVVDRFWWHQYEGKKHLIKNHPILHCGFKGVPGRTGLAEGHKFDDKDYIKDNENKDKLKSYLGEDIVHYNDWVYSKGKSCIYTSVSGSYDSNKPILFKENEIEVDYFYVSDTPPTYMGWIWIPIEENFLCNNLNAKKAKVLNHLFLGFYEKSLFIDSNVFIKSSLCKYFKFLDNDFDSLIAQFAHPERSNPVKEFEICKTNNLDDPCSLDKAHELIKNHEFSNNLHECNFILRKSASSLRKSMFDWFSNILHTSKRDQITHAYSLDENNIIVKTIGEHKENIRNIPELYYVKHGDIEFHDVADRFEV